MWQDECKGLKRKLDETRKGKDKLKDPAHVDSSEKFPQL